MNPTRRGVLAVPLAMMLGACSKKQPVAVETPIDSLRRVSGDDRRFVVVFWHYEGGGDVAELSAQETVLEVTLTLKVWEAGGPRKSVAIRFEADITLGSPLGTRRVEDSLGNVLKIIPT